MTATSWTASDQVLPDYGGKCLVEVPRAIAAAFGAEAAPSGLPRAVRERLNSFDHIVLLVLDGCGWDEVTKARSDVPLLRRFESRGVLEPMTTIFPSSTAPALTSLASGVPPATHALYEWWIIERHWGQTIQSLAFSPADSSERDVFARYGGYPAQLYEGKTVFDAIAEAGVDCFSFLPSAFQQQTYSRATHHGSRFVPYSFAPDMLTSLRKTLDGRQTRSFSYVYWSEVDTLAHRFGPCSEEVQLGFSAFCGMLTQALRPLAGEAAAKIGVVLVADHGHVELDPAAVIRLNDCPEITQNLARNPAGGRVLPAGGPRCVFLDIEPGQVRDVMASLRQRLAGAAEVLSIEEALAKGLFGGPPSQRFLERAGNVLLIAQGCAALWYQYSNRPWNYRGHHGALTPREMLIPLGIASLDALTSD